MERVKHLSGPVRIGLAAAAVAMVLVLIGLARGNVPLNPLSVVMALAISGGSWGVVAWAIATAARDVERDLAEGEDEGESPVEVVESA
jgi:hypothetical protein